MNNVLYLVLVRFCLPVVSVTLMVLIRITYNLYKDVVMCIGSYV